MRYIFTFRSRNAAMNFYAALRRNGIPAVVVNTPRALGIGCGLSVRIDESNLEMTSRILATNRSEWFVGVHEVNARGEVTRRIQ